MVHYIIPDRKPVSLSHSSFRISWFFLFLNHSLLSLRLMANQVCQTACITGGPLPTLAPNLSQRYSLFSEHQTTRLNTSVDMETVGRGSLVLYKENIWLYYSIAADKALIRKQFTGHKNHSGISFNPKYYCSFVQWVIHSFNNLISEDKTEGILNLIRRQATQVYRQFLSFNST